MLHVVVSGDVHETALCNGECWRVDCFIIVSHHICSKMFNDEERSTCI